MPTVWMREAISSSVLLSGGDDVRTSVWQRLNGGGKRVFTLLPLLLLSIRHQRVRRKDLVNRGNRIRNNRTSSVGKKSLK